MIGRYNGFPLSLVEHLKGTSAWCVCMLHTNELTLRHVVLELDGATHCPETFSGPIGSVLGGPVHDWPVVAFQRTPNSSFSELKEDVIEDLSTDQHYAYQICKAVMLVLLKKIYNA